jgi:hypothetical protein
MPIVADNIDTLIRNVKLRQGVPLEFAQQLDVLKQASQDVKKISSPISPSPTSGSSSSPMWRASNGDGSSTRPAHGTTTISACVARSRSLARSS